MPHSATTISLADRLLKEENVHQIRVFLNKLIVLSQASLAASSL